MHAVRRLLDHRLRPSVRSDAPPPSPRRGKIRLGLCARRTRYSDGSICTSNESDFT
jgi:hypothetical protein